MEKYNDMEMEVILFEQGDVVMTSEKTNPDDGEPFEG